jgi:pyruvate decarboxylase
VLNNSGYTVERLIHGPKAAYNDIAIWDYSKLADTFGPAFPSKYYGPIKTAQELVDLLEDSELASAECFQVTLSCC